MKAFDHIRVPGKTSEEYNRCINASPNGTIYALSWYLDIICPDWELLANSDFSTVMPLPVFRVLGRKTIRQPEFAFQLGVFSTQVPDPETVFRCLQAIPGNYRLRKLCLNKYNIITQNKARIYNTAELDLISPYPLTRSRYGKNIQARLDLAEKDALSFMDHTAVNDLVMFSYRLDKISRQKLKPNQVPTLRLIASTAIRYRSGQIASAYDRDNNLCAVILFLTFNGRASILHAAANPEGLKSGAVEFIIDRFIREKSEQDLVLSIDNPEDTYLMETLKNFGCRISDYPCVKQLS